MGRVSFVSHREKRILQIDYSQLAELSDLESIAREAMEIMVREPLGSVLALVDLSDVPYALRSARRLGEMAIAVAPRVHARAIVGLPVGAELVVAELGAVSGTPMQTFANRDAALDWLASHDS